LTNIILRLRPSSHITNSLPDIARGEDTTRYRSLADRRQPPGPILGLGVSHRPVAPEIKFATDAALERRGFEPLVPHEKDDVSRDHAGDSGPFSFRKITLSLARGTGGSNPRSSR